MPRRTFTISLLALGAAMPTFADAIPAAMAEVQKYAGQKTVWDGPTAGPVAALGKSNVVFAADMKNGGVLGVTNGVSETRL